MTPQEENITPHYIKNYSKFQRQAHSLEQIARIEKHIIKRREETEAKREKQLQIKEKEIEKLGEILSIEAYVKKIILTYQDSYTDVKLAQKLGISRKSLWEKRKKLGIPKK